MALNNLDDAFNAALINSFNDTTQNDLAVDVTASDIGNTDQSVNDSNNLGVAIDDSFTVDSHDQELDLDADAEDSFNEFTDNSWNDESDNSIEDSYNTYTDTSVDDSYNTWSFTSTDDHSTNVGVREYNTGFGDLTVGGGSAAAATSGTGELFIDNRATIVDQSVNQNIDAGLVFQGSSADAVVASGDDSVAAGDDVSVTTTLDDSTNITAGGDVNIGNSLDVTATIASNNSYTDNSTYSRESVDVDIEDSWNDNSHTFSASESFNDYTDEYSETDIDIDVDAIVASTGAGIIDDLAIG